MNYFDILKKDYKCHHYKDKEIIVRENSACNKVGFLIKGEIIIKSYQDNGEEIIYNIIKENQIFGNNLIFSDNKKYLGDIVTTKDSEIIFLNKDEFLNLLKDSTILNEYLISQAKESKSRNIRIKLLSIDNYQDRFLYYLSVNNNEMNIKSVTSLASELNMQRETLSRIISKLTKEKIISYNNYRIKRL